MNIKKLSLMMCLVLAGVVGHAGSLFNKEDKSETREYIEDKAEYLSDMSSAQWHKVKGHVKEAYGKLTNDDLLKIEGKKDRFYGVMLQKYGYTKNQANDAWQQIKEQVHD